MAGLAHAHPRDLARLGRAERASEGIFIGGVAVLLGAAVTLTARSAAAMSAMPGMPMPGGWTMSMAWMGRPGQTWLGEMAAFLGMWIAMMAAMMLPALTPTLWRYWRGLVAPEPTRRAWLTAVAGTGYFAFWMVAGVVVYGTGMLVTTIEMARPAVARLVPVAVGLVVVGAGAIQQSGWKARQLAECRTHRASGPSAEHVGSAWRHGLSLGWHCGLACLNLMAISVVLGVMDLRVMAAVTAAITLERLGPSRARATRPVGGLIVALGLLLLARASGLV